MELQFHPDPARKLSVKLYDIYHCCVCSEKLLMMDGETARNMYNLISRINLRKYYVWLVLLYKFIMMHCP